MTTTILLSKGLITVDNDNEVVLDIAGVEYTIAYDFDTASIVITSDTDHIACSPSDSGDAFMIKPSEDEVGAA